MIINKASIASAVSGGAIIVSSLLAPAAFADTITISGNGAGATDHVSVNQNSSDTVTQSNTANVTNNVTTNSTTGDNSANSNTGGSVSMQTGDSSSLVQVSTMANVNKATDPCGCTTGSGNSSITESGNGAGSTNGVTTNNTSSNQTFQTNSGLVSNSVTNNADTGHNNANANTGGTSGGSVSISTGMSQSMTSLKNALNANFAGSTMGGTSGGTGGTSTLNITGNGAGSTNHISLTNDPSTTVTQANSAVIANSVYNNSLTGYNNANSNTGDSVAIHTGSSMNGVMVDNFANFNGADPSCGCLSNSLSALIDGNGAGSYNHIMANLGNSLSIYQGQGAGNSAYLTNNIKGGSNTGSNDSSANTGSTLGGGSNTIGTGGTDDMTQVQNSLNENVVGPMSSLSSMLGGLNFSFDLGSLLNF